MKISPIVIAVLVLIPAVVLSAKLQTSIDVPTDLRDSVAEPVSVARARTLDEIVKKAAAVGITPGEIARALEKARSR